MKHKDRDLMKKIFPLILLCFAFNNIFGQDCDYDIAPSTHHNWVDETSFIYTPCAGLGCDSNIIRNSQKLEISSTPVLTSNDTDYVIKRAYIKFDLFFNDQNSCNFNEGLLHLRFTGNSLDSHNIDSGANDIYVSRIIQDWGEDTLRWENPPTVGINRQPTITTQGRLAINGPSAKDGDLTISIVEFLKFWRNNPDSNFGIEIRLQQESGRRGLTFASAEFPNPSLRPAIDAEVDNCVSRRANAGNDQQICEGESIELQGNFGEFFEWDNNPTLSNLYIANPTARPTQTTTYYLETTVGSCVTRDSVKITVLRYPNLSVGSDKEICEGDSVQISAGGATNYRWTPASYISDPTISDPMFYPRTTTSYVVAADSGNICKAYDTVRVVVRPLTPTEAGLSQKICEGESVVLLASGADTYEWLTNTSSLSAVNVNDPVASPTSTTTYLLRGSNGYCPTTDTVTVTVVPKFSVDAGPDTSICLGQEVFMDAESGFRIYRWSPSGLFNNSTIRDPKIENLQQTTTVTLRVEDENRCEATDEVIITVNNPPQLELGPDTFVCEESTILMDQTTVNGDGPFTYNWSPVFGMDPDDQFAREPEITGLRDTMVIYTVVVTDKNNCTATDDVRLTILQNLEIETFGDTTICQGVATDLSVKGGIFFEWSGDNIISPNLKKSIRVQPDKPTTYKVIAENGEDCGIDSGYVDVNVIQLPNVYVHRRGVSGEEDTIYRCKGREIILVGEGADTYIWSTEDTAQSINHRVLIDQEVISVYGISDGCAGPLDTTLIRLDKADSCASKVFVPTAFTPNDDLLNDSFVVVTFLIRNYNIKIFNRWGQELFRSSTPSEAWDGTFKGRLVPEGVYYYTIEAFGEDEESRSTNGTFHVIY